MNVEFLFQIAALVFVLFAAFGVFPNGKVQWGWLGLAMWFLSFMIGAIWLHQASSIH